MLDTLKCKRRTIGTRRFEVNLDVQMLLANRAETGREAIGVVRNLSLRGALIETHALLQEHDRLTLYLTLPNHADELEIPSAVVQWVGERQVGIEFLKLSKKASQTLMRYLSVHYVTKYNSPTRERVVAQL
jgi:hypothetical protein